jgi:hypothetical protein
MSISQNFLNSDSTLNFNFAATRKLDPRVSFARTDATTCATYMDKTGTIQYAQPNQPRFDHSYDGQTVNSQGLLLEGTATNLLSFSTIIDGGIWSYLNTNATTIITTNGDTSPDGTQNASAITINGVSDEVYTILSLTSGTTYTYSLFLSGSSSVFFGSDLGTLASINIDLSTGVTSTKFGSPTNITVTQYPYGPYQNKWYKVSLTFTASFTGNHTFVIGTSSSYASWSVYGAQVEVGNFATSYIPTSGLPVTRAADSAIISGVNNLATGTLVSSGTTAYLGFTTSTTLNINQLKSSNNRVSNITLYPSLSLNSLKAIQKSYSCSSIVTDGLVLYLDAANSFSYPGNGTVWSDLSGNSNTGTLTNGSNYNSADGGSLVFGTNNYVSLPANKLNFGTGQFTMEAWVYSTADAATSNIILYSQSSNNAGFFGFGYNASGFFLTDYNGSTRNTTNNTTAVISLNSWYHIVVLRSSSNRQVVYVNTVASNSVTNAISTFSLTATDPRIGINPISSAETWIGRIPNVKIYNRALSASEIQQNFNATRGRYGI